MTDTTSPAVNGRVDCTAIRTAAEQLLAVQTLFATDPITQAAIDTYNQNVGPVAEFLGHQAAISGAFGAAGC